MRVGGNSGFGARVGMRLTMDVFGEYIEDVGEDRVGNHLIDEFGITELVRIVPWCLLTA